MTDGTRAGTAHNAQGQFESTVDDAEKAAEAARMRGRLRMSYREIGAAQGVSASTAYRRVQAALAAVPVEAVDELRKVELEALDAIAQGLMLITAAASGASRSERIAAFRELRHVSESRRRLLGTDAPTSIALQVTDSMQAEIDQMIREAQAAGIDIIDPTAGAKS